jgi:hypothetical protein
MYSLLNGDVHYGCCIVIYCIGKEGETVLLFTHIPDLPIRETPSHGPVVEDLHPRASSQGELVS